MSFRLFTLLVLISASVKVSSQQIDWGNPQKIKQKNLYTQIIGENPDGIYMLRCKNGDFSSDVIIEKYRPNLSQELSINIPMTVNGLLERVLLVNNVLYEFISAKNTGTGNIDILVQKLDANLKPLGNPVVICSFPASGYLEKRKIQIKTSADKQSVGIMFLTKSTGSNESKLNVYGYNSQLQQQYGKQFTLNYSSQEIFITSYDLDNSGNSFVLIDFPDTRKSIKRDPRSFYLYSYFYQSDKMLAYQLGNDSTFIEELGMSVNNFNKSVCVFGFYSLNESEDATGYFYERISLESRMSEQRVISIVPQLNLEKMVAGRFDKKGNLSLNNYYIRRLIPRSDGGLFVVAEKFQRIEQRFSYYLNNMPMEGVRIIYNFDDVAVASVNADGTFHFTDILKKKQSSVGDAGYAGVSVIPTQDNIHVLYNSDLDQDANVMDYSVSYMGKSDEKVLIKNNNFNILMIPGEFRQISGNSILAATVRDKNFTLVRITF